MPEFAEGQNDCIDCEKVRNLGNKIKELRVDNISPEVATLIFFIISPIKSVSVQARGCRVDRHSQPLFATQIVFRRLDTDME